MSIHSQMAIEILQNFKMTKGKNTLIIIINLLFILIYHILPLSFTRLNNLLTYYSINDIGN